jgi:hypothetical protein
MKPKLKDQIKVSLSKDTSQSSSLKRIKTYKAVCRKNAKIDTDIFQANKALRIPTNDSRMLLLNIQAIKATKIHAAQANSLVDKLLIILSIYFSAGNCQ